MRQHLCGAGWVTSHPVLQMVWTMTCSPVSTARGDQVLKWDDALLSWDCADDDTGTEDWSLAGNGGTVPGTHFLGTTDDTALQLHVNSARALRLEPHATSPNIIGGYSGNSVAPGAYGATISGGGETGNSNIVTDKPWRGRRRV